MWECIPREDFTDSRVAQQFVSLIFTMRYLASESGKATEVCCWGTLLINGECWVMRDVRNRHGSMDGV